MPLIIVRNDITKMRVDAIVNAANETLLGGGGVDGSIHSAAGPELLAECRALGGCRVGEAKLTRGYALPCKYVIHTVGPVWSGGLRGEREALASCYSASLELAKAHGCESVAFPLISSGAYGYPKAEALKTAMDTISGFLLENDMTVYIAIFDRTAFQISGKLFADIEEYIDDNYVSAHSDDLTERRGRQNYRRWSEDGEFDSAALFTEPAPKQSDIAPLRPAAAQSLDDAVKRLDESFSQMLLRKIDEKGMTDSECYKKANIDRKLFSKIRGDAHYKPSKPTAIAFAVALELPIGETRDLLMKAGFALSHSSKFDIIIEYFIQSGNYNIFEINEALFAFDQSLLGA